MVFLTGAGCTSGFIYSNVTRPLTTDMHQTPVGRRVCQVNSKHLEEPLTGLDITVEWDSRSIADAARQAGFETVLKQISFLGGLWKKQTVCVCGE